ncbi:pyridoxal phosphate-dependent aminotransferase family protein [Lusitaniella coriacea LEGE 07157]|uniref:Pyridoxal phosphate-dependent aminotransferase family protein n=1 Tax=Lusitaniella coriacea LEGE 07157 TaxID=945747 RepID=A0A8J7B2D8_9CYAN|nr:pyridoxal phosphate-dependent aminotransferase family protein [Lusitaniella coriacea LEGE 07157]
MEVVQEYMQAIYRNGLYPDEYICHHKQGNLVEIEAEATGVRHKVLTFCTNDILGLVGSESVKQAAIDAVLQYGTSNSSCPTLSGRIDLHRQLEREISAFKQLPHTHLFINAWMAMQALMDGFCHLAAPIPGFYNTRETLVMTDVFNHGCIVSALVNAKNLSGRVVNHSANVRVKPYRHCDGADLARKLRRYAQPDDRIMVVSDAVFSMEGDIAPLPEILAVLENYPGSVIVMDEAHASGAIGASGGGIYEHFGITPQDVLKKGVVPLIVTTFSKFAASAGAAISSHSPEFIDLLDACPTSIGTISLPAPTTAAALEAIRQVRKAPKLVQKLQANTRYLRSRLMENEFTTMGETQVIPVFLSPELDPKPFASHLIERHGIWISPIWYRAKPRLRITANALHTEEEMDRLVAAMVATRKALSQPQKAGLGMGNDRESG